MSLVGATSLGWKGDTVPQMLERLRAMGGECVELNSRDRMHGDLVLDSSTIPQVRSWAADAGVVISSVAGYNDFARKDSASLRSEVERLLAACRIASEMEVPIVRAFVGDVKPDVELEDVRSGIVESFGQASRGAESLGVKLAIENHGRLLNDGVELAHLVKEVGSAALGITVDTGNFCWAGHSLEQAQRDWEAVMPYAFSVHIKDGMWKDGSFEFVVAGEGDLDLAGYLRKLVENGYDGPVYSEYEGAGDVQEGTRKSIAYLKQVLA